MKPAEPAPESWHLLYVRVRSAADLNWNKAMVWLRCYHVNRDILNDTNVNVFNEPHSDQDMWSIPGLFSLNTLDKMNIQVENFEHFASFESCRLLDKASLKQDGDKEEEKEVENLSLCSEF